MAKLIITRGLPGSGKTTAAREWVAEDAGNRVRVNRDDLRAMAFGGFVKESEYSLTLSRDAFVSTMLRRGHDVVVDDTNLPNKTVRHLMRLAESYEIWDFTDVPLETCLERNSSPSRVANNEVVPENVIRDMHQRFIKGREHPLPAPEIDSEEAEAPTLYQPRPGTPRAVIVDMDGTLALHTGRSPYDMTRVSEDQPNEAVIETVRSLYLSGFRVVIVSARTEEARKDTEAWLDTHGRVPYEGLFLRGVSDGRRDSEVKSEIFDTNIRDRYDVKLVLDDRDAVVAMWRSMGIPCFQVAPGKF